MCLANAVSPVMAHEAMDCALQVPSGGAIQQATPTQVISQGAPLLQPVLDEVANSQGGALVQPAPAEVLSSQGGLAPLQPVPPASIDATEENMDIVDPGTSEADGQGPGANQTVQAEVSMHNFISGLQRLHGMLEWLRPPPSDHSVGPVRTRRRTGSILRARAGASQRADSAR